MKNVAIPPTCGPRALLRAMHRAGVFNERWDHLNFELRDDSFLFPSAISYLASWGLGASQLDKEISFSGDETKMRYLARMDLFSTLGIRYDERFDRHNEVGRFVPVKLICEQGSVLEAVNAICDLVLHQFPNGGAFIESLEWAVNEIIDNIVTHSQSPTCGTMCAQYFPNKRRMRVGVSDAGIGIKATIGESYDVGSHGAAIRKAVQRGITRNRRVGQGNGLAGTYQIAQLNGGVFHIFSGDAMFVADEEDTVLDLPVSIQGTTVYLGLDTDRPVDLMDTFMAEQALGWTILDRESDRFNQAGSIEIRQECIHVGGRPPATALRQKLLNLMPRLEGTLGLDFRGCRPSSSFLDELLGFMVRSMGRDEFLRKFQIQNLDERRLRMAENVIHQRIQEDEDWS